MNEVLDATAIRRRDTIQHALIVMLVAVTALTALGVFMVFSATAPLSIRAADATASSAVFTTGIRQATFAFIGLVGGLVLANIPYRFTRRFTTVILVVGLALQAGVLIQGGEGVGGNNNWLNLGPLSIQPSEFIKFGLVLWLASELAKLSADDVAGSRRLIVPGIGFGAAVMFVLLGGDMGTSLVFMLIGVGMVWLAGMRSKYLIIVGGVGAMLAAILIAVQPTRLSRVTDFFRNLFSLPDTIMPTQSEYAIFAFGTGGWTGAGIGGSREKWRDLAEAHTDFIFAVIGEELGFLGVLTVVALFLALGWALVRICVNHPDRYAQLLSAGAALWLCGQAFANMFVVTGLLPVFGVPLPFLSQGGSSMMAALFMIGAVAACALAVPGVKDSFRIRTGIASRARSLVQRPA